ncbi:MAG: hypothetical protein ABIH23_08240 [bacterium]
MDENCRRYYTLEEEFLNEFYNEATVAAEFLNGEWLPDSDANDTTRRNRD